MRVRTYLRRRRVALGLSLQDVLDLTGVPRPDLSRIERGYQFPRADQAAALAPVLGDPADWYPPGVWRALAPDLAACPHCDEELDPGDRANRRYHPDCPHRPLPPHADGAILARPKPARGAPSPLAGSLSEGGR